MPEVAQQAVAGVPAAGVSVAAGMNHHATAVVQTTGACSHGSRDQKSKTKVWAGLRSLQRP